VLRDLDGREVRPLEDPGAKASVFLFVRSDCPISNRYAPEVRRLHERFSRQGVAFWLVYPDPAESPERIRGHVKEYGYPMPALRDPAHVLAEAAAVRVTPEAAVFTAGAGGVRLVYHGRIDDRQVDFGRTRPAPTRRDLEDALSAILKGQPAPRASAPAVGCFVADTR
jgi:AhpC/TSA family